MAEVGGSGGGSGVGNGLGEEGAPQRPDAVEAWANAEGDGDELDDDLDGLEFDDIDGDLETAGDQRNELTCPVCGQLWNAKVNKTNPDYPVGKLLMFCNKCEHVEEAVSNIVFEHKISKEKGASLVAYPSDMIKDPTLQRTKDARCPNCGHHEAVFFMEGATGKDQTMKLVFMCVGCMHKWIS